MVLVQICCPINPFFFCYYMYRRPAFFKQKNFLIRVKCNVAVMASIVAEIYTFMTLKVYKPFR